MYEIQLKFRPICQKTDDLRFRSFFYVYKGDSKHLGMVQKIWIPGALKATSTFPKIKVFAYVPPIEAVCRILSSSIQFAHWTFLGCDVLCTENLIAPKVIHHCKKCYTVPDTLLSLVPVSSSNQWHHAHVPLVTLLASDKWRPSLRLAG
jgi:hypothetical protein